MFCFLSDRDMILLFRGVVMLTLAIVIGVGVAQQQLNSLTARQENILACSMTYHPSGMYTIYIGRDRYQFSARYLVGEIINQENAIILKTTRYSIAIPKYIQLDCRSELAVLEFCIKRVQEKLNVYTKAFR